MHHYSYLISFLFYTFIAGSICSQQPIYPLEGLEETVEIIVDEWGIPHIYAATEADLFFAQGFYAAQDRMFQFEIWRRQATGTVAEILGKRELERDKGTRLFKFRGDIQREMDHYHPRGSLIITSFVEGVNAYIDQTRLHPELLPPEFNLLGIKPQYWTPEIVISRHQGLLGNIEKELATARAVVLLGENNVKELSHFHPGDPDLSLSPTIDQELLFEDILGIYNAFRKPIEFRPEDLVASASNKDWEAFQYLAGQDKADRDALVRNEQENIGSNNWVINGSLTASGFPMMANDPHRRQSAPSLRYMAHLVGPGWNVIGGGEPEIPGISIGHNEYGAWGLTVFSTDAEDLYVYETHPDNPNQYKYQGTWVDMHLIEEEISVKDQEAVNVTFKYTRHGPVIFEDEAKHAAIAMRCGWMEIGGSPYLASLRMDQARSWEEFQQACNYSHIPGENMVWADKEGNIGWQAVGIAPIRRNFSGLVPVPGDGSFEWEGYLPIIAKPKVVNPKEGFFATSNENVTPNSYLYMDAIGFQWSDPFRGNRVREVLSSGRKFTLMDMAQLQTDYLSLPARQLVPLLKNTNIEDQELQQAISYLLAWDHQLLPTSIAAGIYHQWEREIRSGMEDMLVMKEAQPYISLPFSSIIDWLILPDGKFGENPVAGRNAFLMEALQKAVDHLSQELGEDMSQWAYGQPSYKHIYIKHPLSNAVNEEWREKLDVGPAVRGGNSYTVNNTSGNNNQTSGASFRMIVDTEDWDKCIGTNAPGQAGNPEDKHYRNLFDIWAKDQYFPIFYSQEKVLSVKDEIWLLEPKE